MKTISNEVLCVIDIAHLELLKIREKVSTAREALLRITG